MSHKLFVSALSFVAVLIFAVTAVVAQIAPPISGKVELVKADGTREVVVGALVEVYQIDAKIKPGTVKTDKSGMFSVTGLKPGATYIVAISSANAAPEVMENIKPGNQSLNVELKPGDGGIIPEVEIRKALAALTGGSVEGLNAEQKKLIAEEAAKNKAIEEKNKDIASRNELKVRLVNEANTALTAKNYDVAVAKFNECYEADPQFVGSAAPCLSNKAIALLPRAIEAHNASTKATGDEKAALGAKATKDFADAATAYLMSFNLLKSAKVTDAEEKTRTDTRKVTAINGSVDVYRKALQAKRVDPAVIEAAKIMVPEYLLIETDTGKKKSAIYLTANFYLVNKDFENTVAEYKKILEKSPDDLDALSGVGFALINDGYNKDDKAILQEGADMLQKFVSLAPDSNDVKAEAKGAIESLKTDQNLTPQKVPAATKTPTKKRN